MEEADPVPPDLAKQHVQIIVTELRVRYHRPATAREARSVHTEIAGLRRAGKRGRQRLFCDCDGVLMVEAEITAGISDYTGKPRCPPPRPMDTFSELSP